MIDCVQDVTVGYRGGKKPENESDFLFGNLPNEIHFYVDKFQASDLLIETSQSKGKSTDLILEEWLTERWLRKEYFLNE